MGRRNRRGRRGGGEEGGREGEGENLISHKVWFLKLLRLLLGGWEEIFLGF